MVLSGRALSLDDAERMARRRFERETGVAPGDYTVASVCREDELNEPTMYLTREAAEANCDRDTQHVVQIGNAIPRWIVREGPERDAPISANTRECAIPAPGGNW